MMFTVRMRLLDAAVPSSLAKATADELVRTGCLEAISFRQPDDTPSGRLSSVERDPSLERVRDARRRVEGLMSLAEPPLSRPLDSDFHGGPFDLAAVESRVDAMASDIQAIRDKQKETQDKILRLDEIARQLERGAALGDAARRGLSRPEERSFLLIRAGSVPASEAERLDKALAAFPSVLAPLGGADGRGVSEDGRFHCLVAALRRDETRVDSALRRSDWTDEASDARGNAAEALKEVADKRSRLALELEERRRDVGRLIRDKASELGGLWVELRGAELSQRLRSSFSHTDSTTLLSGWLPAKDSRRAEDAIRAATGGRCHIEWTEASEAAAAGLVPPSAMRNPDILRPFQTLVSNFGVPAYGTVDPTPLVAAAYLIMFGLMFGDAGHGAVLAVAGLLGRLRARKHGKPDTLFTLIWYCGLAAIAAGILFGSYFGMGLLKPLWFDYHGVVAGHARGGTVSSIYDILGITIKFGIVVLGTGLVLNWINLVRQRRWVDLFFDKAGLAGGMVYGAGAWASFWFVASSYKTLPPADILLLVLGLPTVLLAFKAPLERLEHKARGAGGGKLTAGTVMSWIMEWLVSVLEVYSGYLANTLSFMRVAGLGIAHVSLMSAFFQIAGMVNPGGGFSVTAILILVAGNVLVIALEGLSAGIQALRLNYYEFFSKFFNGSGRAYSPISFRSAD